MSTYLLPTAVIFDLDGTLIDSAPSILASFRQVLQDAALSPREPLDAAIIGPPLRQTLTKLTGLTDEIALNRLAAGFMASYDSEGYKASRVYPGIAELLKDFHARGIPMGIATNKRRVPTLKILECLGWTGLFQMVGTLDTPDPPHANKAALIGSLLDKLDLEACTSLYIGDKWEDGEAAAANGMRFIAARWGYGSWDRNGMPAGWHLSDKPEDLYAHLFKRHRFG